MKDKTLIIAMAITLALSVSMGISRAESDSPIASIFYKIGDSRFISIPVTSAQSSDSTIIVKESEPLTIMVNIAAPGGKTLHEQPLIPQGLQTCFFYHPENVLRKTLSVKNYVSHPEWATVTLTGPAGNGQWKSSGQGLRYGSRDLKLKVRYADGTIQEVTTLKIILDAAPELILTDNVAGTKIPNNTDPYLLQGKNGFGSEVDMSIEISDNNRLPFLPQNLNALEMRGQGLQGLTLSVEEPYHRLSNGTWAAKWRLKGTPNEELVKWGLYTKLIQLQAKDSNGFVSTKYTVAVEKGLYLNIDRGIAEMTISNYSVPDNTASYVIRLFAIGDDNERILIWESAPHGVTTYTNGNATSYGGLNLSITHPVSSFHYEKMGMQIFNAATNQEVSPLILNS